MRLDMQKNSTKQMVMPAMMGMMNAGRVKYALSRNQPAEMIASTLAAAGGILSSWLRGSPANPRSVTMVGKYHDSP